MDSIFKSICSFATVYCGEWRHIVLLTVCVYSSSYEGLYIIEICATRRFEKMGVSSSVCLPVCNTNKKTYSFIIDSRKIIRISGERVWHPLQENEAIFSKNYV